MDVTQIFLAAVSTTLLAACATISKPDIPPASDPVQTHLAPRTLAPGDCGLFVWTADAKKNFILFSQSDSNTGAWIVNGNEAPLTITQQSGDPANQQYPNAVYTGQDGSEINLSLTNREPIIDGTRFKAGTLKRTDANGWERIIPVVGLSACQPN